MESINSHYEEIQGSGDPFQYRNVYVLLCIWEAGDIEPVHEVLPLYHVFRSIYGFKVFILRIPSSQLGQPPEIAIQERLAAVKSKLTADDLLIFHYIGHGGYDSRKYFLFAKGGNFPPPEEPERGKLEWSPVFKTLRSMGTDVLILIDACHSAGAARIPRRTSGNLPYPNRIEIITSSGYFQNSPASAASFSTALHKSLVTRATKNTTFSASMLHRELFNSILDENHGNRCPHTQTPFHSSFDEDPGRPSIPLRIIPPEDDDDDEDDRAFDPLGHLDDLFDLEFGRGSGGLRRTPLAIPRNSLRRGAE